MLRTKKQIAETVIRDYEYLIKKAKRIDYPSFISLLVKHNAQLGICYYLKQKYEVEISHRRYVKKHSNCSRMGDYQSLPRGYWYKAPEYSKSKKEAVECLQKRIDILKTWL